MGNTASERMRNHANSQNFSHTGEIMKAMKGLFRDALQQVMEGKLDEQLGCEKSERISEAMVSKISEKIMPEVTAWQNRPLKQVYPFVFMDAIHYKVKENHQYITQAAYVVWGIRMDGRKDILGVFGLAKMKAASFLGAHSPHADAALLQVNFLLPLRLLVAQPRFPHRLHCHDFKFCCITL